MIIERTDKEFIIRPLLSVDTEELQKLAYFFRYKEIPSTYSTQQDIVDNIASEINKNLHKANRARLLE
jgi:hypothetical protein